MRTWAKGTARAALLTAGFVALGSSNLFPAVAFADTSGNHSVLGGNQLNLPISAPIDASGNAVAVAGHATAGSRGGASVTGTAGNGTGGQTSGNGSVGGGNQVSAPISAPIDACGNAIAIFGVSGAGCKGGAKVDNSAGMSGSQQTSGNHSVAGGNQVNAPISAPVNACGNALALFGAAGAGCEGGASTTNGGAASGSQQTSGNHSVLGGNQVTAPVSAPVNICGNSAALFGKAVAGCKGGATVTGSGDSGYGSGSGQQTSGNGSVGGGNQVMAPISAPVDVCGNAVGNATAGCEGGASVMSGADGGGSQQTSGRHSVLGGNQVQAPVTAPVDVCGNAVAVLGTAGAFCEGGASTGTGGSGGSGADMQTSGDHSVLGGNQVHAPIKTPVSICGNAVAVLGGAVAGCTGTTSIGGDQGGSAMTSGNGSVGGGNQADAPVTAPVDVCGNSAAVLGTAMPGCNGTGSGGSGGSGYPGGGDDSSTPSGSDDSSAPSGDDSSTPGTGDCGCGGGYGASSMTGDAAAAPVAAASALPPIEALQQLPAASALPAQGLPTQDLPAQGLPAQGLPTQDMPVRTLPKAEGTDLPAELPAKAPATLPATVPAGLASGLPTGLPAGAPVAPGLVSGLPQLPATPARFTPAVPGDASRTNDPVPADLPAGASLPVAGQLPVVGQGRTPVQPGLPVGTGAVTGKVGAVGNTAGNLVAGVQSAKDEVTEMKPMAASESLAGSGSSSASLVLLGALMAGASAVLAFGRRVRAGRR